MVRPIGWAITWPTEKSSKKRDIWVCRWVGGSVLLDRKSTRLNSSHGYISYAVFCLKKKNSYDHGHHPSELNPTLTPHLPLSQPPHNPAYTHMHRAFGECAIGRSPRYPSHGDSCEVR